MDHEVAVQCTECDEWVTNVTWFHPEEVIVKDGYVFRSGSEWARLPIEHPVFQDIELDEYRIRND